MDYFTALKKLRAIRQEHLLILWNKLSELQQDQLLKQIQRIDLNLFIEQQNILAKKALEPQKAISPYRDFAYAGGHPEDISDGHKLIAEGQVGCLLVAGGQGSRLRFDGPKGMFPLTRIKNKSLLQLMAERVVAASKKAQRPLPLAIMTSPLNNAMTHQFFEHHHFFGLHKEQVSFFQQGMLPLLNHKGNTFLENFESIAEGPDGNGSSLHHFIKSGIWTRWYTQGVRYINFILIDNALADPFDAELVGFHARKEADVTVKCTERNHPTESVGLLVKLEDKIAVVEYSEFPKEERESEEHRCVNMSLFCLSMDFVRNLENYHLPLHLAHKAVKMMDDHGNIHHSEHPNAWKFEKFIFDILPSTDRVESLYYPRSKTFAPLKNLTGEDSLETVQAALLNRDKEILKSITGHEPPHHDFELSPEFYYPTEELLRKWQGKKPPPTPYIET